MVIAAGPVIAYQGSYGRRQRRHVRILEFRRRMGRTTEKSMRVAFADFSAASAI